MYERYEPSDKIFVNREEYLDWMQEALKRCKDKSVVLHLRGIGGIGKSSLIDHWTSTIESTIRLDCEQHTEFYTRLNVLAKGAVHLGVKLQRFDVLWQIRQRFVEGVEPGKEAGREWAKEIVTAIPFIGSLASIGSAISAVGAKVAPKLKGRYGSLGEWLKARLGKNHMERLLEILWKEPRHAEFLYLDALLEDINGRKNLDSSILFLLDHFESVDTEKMKWRYSGKEITETELWCVFLSSLANCVGVMASRRTAPDYTTIKIEIEEDELTELEREYCIELLDLRKITDEVFQEKIVSVSGGNPFVIGTICDMMESTNSPLEDIDSLRSDTLEGVRLKTWRRLFDRTHDLQGYVEKAGLVPFFDRRIMGIISPDMRTDHWDRLIRLSFVKDRGDGTWVLHELAKELVIAELGSRLQVLAGDLSKLLENAHNEDSDYTLLGTALSVQALSTETEVAIRINRTVRDLHYDSKIDDALTLIDSINATSPELSAALTSLRAICFLNFRRYSEAYLMCLEVIDILQARYEELPDAFRIYLGRSLHQIGCIQLGAYTADRFEYEKAETNLGKAIEIFRNLEDRNPGFASWELAWSLSYMGIVLMSTNRISEAGNYQREMVSIIKQFVDTEMNQSVVRFGLMLGHNRLAILSLYLGNFSESIKLFKEALDIDRKQASDSFVLRWLSTALRVSGNLHESISIIQEDIESFREIVKKDPDGEFYLTQRLWIKAASLSLINAVSEAEKMYIETIELCREQVTKEDSKENLFLATTLTSFAVLLSKTGRFDEAKVKCKEALEINRRFAESHHSSFQRHVAWTLNNYGVLLRNEGKYADAEIAYREALEITKKSFEESPEFVWMKNLTGVVLNNLSILLKQTDRRPEAEKIFKEALDIRRELAEISPEFFLHRVGVTLNNFGVFLFEEGKSQKAEVFLLEALQLRRELRKTSEELYIHKIASTLTNLGIVFKNTDRVEEAINAYSEAVAIGEKLVADTPTVFKQMLVRSLINYTILMRSIERDDDESRRILSRLKELGVENVPENEEWSEEEEEEIDYVVN